MRTVDDMKKNEKLFSRLSPAERAIFERVGRDNCVVWIDSWQDCGNPKGQCPLFLSTSVYRVKEDYVEQKSVELCEVYLDRQTGNYVFDYDGCHYLLQDAVSMRYFRCFEYRNGTRGIHARTIYGGYAADAPSYVVFSTKERNV